MTTVSQGGTQKIATEIMTDEVNLGDITRIMTETEAEAEKIAERTTSRTGLLVPEIKALIRSKKELKKENSIALKDIPL